MNEWMNEVLVLYSQHIGVTHHTTSVCFLFYISYHITSFIFCHASPKGGPGQLSRYSDSLRAGRSKDRIPVGARFSAPVQTGPGARPASYTVGTRSFPGVKWPGCGVDHTPPSSAEVKERVELYLYSPSVPLWPLLKRERGMCSFICSIVYIGKNLTDFWVLWRVLRMVFCTQDYKICAPCPLPHFHWRAQCCRIWFCFHPHARVWGGKCWVGLDGRNSS
jgi:hypothetical protein